MNAINHRSAEKRHVSDVSLWPIQWKSRVVFKKDKPNLEDGLGGRPMAQKTYRIESFRIGSKSQGDQIVFASLEDMEQAYKDIDNGRDIYIEKDGVVTKLLQPMLTSKIYDGTIVLSARVSPSTRQEE
jgi:hypothetical protein